jgi:hypothetical protein
MTLVGRGTMTGYIATISLPAPTSPNTIWDELLTATMPKVNKNKGIRLREMPQTARKPAKSCAARRKHTTTRYETQTRSFSLRDASALVLWQLRHKPRSSPSPHRYARRISPMTTECA